jgi:phage-related protein
LELERLSIQFLPKPTLQALHSLAENTQAPNLGEERDQASSNVAENHRADTYRAVYTVEFERAVYVLHAFQKKSPSGIKTARKDVELIGRRLNDARADYQVRYGKEKK